MLLGIVYHAALSLASNFPWFVQDPASDSWMYGFASFVHGFRMPLFFLLSGFFTAMLWVKRGALALIWHRFRRVLLPCLLGCITLVPLSNLLIGYAMKQSAEHRNAVLAAGKAEPSVWEAIRKFDTEAVRGHLEGGASMTELHRDYRLTPLTWAALVGDVGTTQLLLERGCDPNIRNEDGGTALHAAAFLGRAEVAHLLIEGGADVSARNAAGESPLGTAHGDLAFVPYITGLIGLQAELADVKSGRSRIITELESHQAVLHTRGGSQGAKASGNAQRVDWNSIWQGLIYIPVFSYLWFLWMLWWLVVAFALAQAVLRRIPWRGVDWKWMLTPAAIACMMGLTMLPTSFMGALAVMLGPDTSVGLVPMPHVFAYYAVFFFFGIAYYLADDQEQRLGCGWRWMLPAALLVVFPIALELNTGIWGWRQACVPASLLPLAANASQTLYAWWMSLGCIGWFQAIMKREKPWVRYMSDASYWMYVAHFPLVIIAQVWVLRLPVPASLKLLAISAGTILVLLVSYHTCVRSTWLGWFLNGTRTPRKPPAPAADAASPATTAPAG